MKIFYTIIIVVFCVYFVFADECKHPLLSRFFAYGNRITSYLGLWYTYKVFSTPSAYNRKLLLNVEYDNDEKELMNLFDYENMIFLDKKANTFDIKFIENLMVNLKNRSYFSYYLKDNIEKIENKKIKKINFIIEKKAIPCIREDILPHDVKFFNDTSSFELLSFHNFQ